MTADVHPFDLLDEDALRRRQSAKFSFYGPDVLPAWVAEMDYPLAEPIQHALRSAIDDGDAGYACAVDVGSLFATWAQERWSWAVDPSDVRLVPDVVTGISELLQVATQPGDGVVIEPPVYPPFAGTVRALHRRVLEAPLVRTPSGWTPDLVAIERAYDAGARAHLLCSPQNPTGIVYTHDALARIASLAEAHRVLVIADEIHAPLTLRGASHIPFPNVSAAARRQGIVLTSASKAWNVAGLKAAFMAAAPGEARRILSRVPPEVTFHAGHFGVLAARAAFRDGGVWIAQVEQILDRNRHLLRDLLASELPSVGYVPPQASYLAWLDCGSLGLGPDPAQAFLTTGRLAVSSGPTFGTQGAGFVRLNIATSRARLEEAVQRMKRSL